MIDENGENLGEMETSDALKITRAKGLDLVEVAPKAKPPVCRIVELGKWKYEQAKKERKQRQAQKSSQSEVKGVRITFRASTHDLEMRARQADEFLEEGHMVRVEMLLRGREKGKKDFAKEKMREFFTMLSVPHKIQQDVKKGGRGLEAIIVKDK